MYDLTLQQKNNPAFMIRWLVGFNFPEMQNKAVEIYGENWNLFQTPDSLAAYLLDKFEKGKLDPQIFDVPVLKNTGAQNKEGENTEGGNTPFSETTVGGIITVVGGVIASIFGGGNDAPPPDTTINVPDAMDWKKLSVIIGGTITGFILVGWLVYSITKK